MPAPTHSRGRVAPPNLQHLVQLSHRRHQHRLNSLSPATEPTWDSRSLGWIGPVKDQGNCGSCWDFSGTGVVEVAYNKAGLGGGSNRFVLSEEYTLSCARNGGCNGDDNTTVLQWAKMTGLPLSSDYGPYTQKPGVCNYRPGMLLYTIQDWGFADSSGGLGVTPTQDIKNAIKSFGCVGCAIAADESFEYADPTQVFMGSGSTDIDHDIILVGWDDSKGAWILRNSWSTQWGEGGYLWIAYGANLVGTEAVFAVPPAIPMPFPPTPPGPPAPVKISLTLSADLKAGTYTIG